MFTARRFVLAAALVTVASSLSCASRDATGGDGGGAGAGASGRDADVSSTGGVGGTTVDAAREATGVIDAETGDAGARDTPADVSTKPCGAFALCDDFEGVAVGGAPEPALWTVGAPDVTGAGALAIDDSQHHSGARAVKVTGQGGYSNHIFFTNRTAIAPLGAVVWARFYVRFADALGDGHVTFLAMKDAADGGKFLRMGGQAKILMWNRESDDATLPALSPAGIAQSRAPTPGTWLCVELMVDGNAGGLRTWVDGAEVPALIVDGTPTADVDEQWLRRASWRPRLVDLSFGWESYAGQPMTLWFDDVALDAARIGCR